MNRYYIYKKSGQTGIVRYWDRRIGMWTKWLDNCCYYDTERGVNRIYNKLTKSLHFGEKDIIGWKLVNQTDEPEETRTEYCYRMGFDMQPRVCATNPKRG